MDSRNSSSGVSQPTRERKVTFATNSPPVAKSSQSNQPLHNTRYNLLGGRDMGDHGDGTREGVGENNV